MTHKLKNILLFYSLAVIVGLFFVVIAGLLLASARQPSGAGLATASADSAALSTRASMNSGGTRGSDLRDFVFLCLGPAVAALVYAL